MVLSDMDDGGSFLDVINENELFGHVGQEEDGNSGFNWADEFLSTTEVDESGTGTHLIQNENISPVEVTPLSIQNQLAVQQNVVNAQNYITQGSAMQGVPRSTALGGMQIVQGGAGLVQQPAAAPQAPQISMSAMGHFQPGLGQQIVQGPNGQLILKSAGGGQIFFQTHPQIQSLQSATSQAPNLQQVTGSSQVINRILAPNQSPVSTSPIVTRSMTPVTSPQVGRSLTPIQSWSGMNPVTMVTSSVNPGQMMGSNVLHLTNNTQTPQMLARNIPIQFNTSNAGLQLQGQSALLQQGQGTILQQGQGQSTILQPTQGSNTLLQQGQGQSAVLQGQGQNIVNTQNTVIQNPNVVNLNVAHVLCNNPQLQNQTGSTVHHMAPNIQGTLIQTADGKHIIIPSNSVSQTVGGQSINIQNLPQMTIQPQLNLATQNPNTGSNMVQGVLGGATNIAGNLGNVIRLTSQGGSATPTPVPTQDKANQLQQQQQPSHFIGVNQQGQQILIQRTQNTAGQPQNIILRTLNPNFVHLPQQQQQQQQQQQPQLQATSGLGATPPVQGTPATQQVLVSQPQGGGGIQLQRFVNTSQGQQQVKVISHGNNQAAGMPFTINWGTGIQNNTNNATLPTTIQVVPQQQVTKTIGSSADGADLVSHQLPASSQVGMTFSSPSAVSSSSTPNRTVTVKSLQSQHPQQIQQLSQPSSFPLATTNSRQAQYSKPSSSKIALSSMSPVPQQTDIVSHSAASPHQLVQSLQNVQIPLGSQYAGSLSMPSLNTASTTTVTTTVTQSRLPMTTTSQATMPVMSSVQLPQIVVPNGTVQKQTVLQARDSAPKLQQHTIHLTPEAQQRLQQIQADLKKLSGLKNPNNAQKVQRKHLLEVQTKILSEGQKIRPSVQTTASPLTQHFIGQQSQQPFQTHNVIGQNVQLIGGQSQNVTSSQFVVAQNQVVSQGTVLQHEGVSFQGAAVKEPTLGTAGIVQSQKSQTSLVQGTKSGMSPQVGHLVIKTEAMQASPLSTLISSSQVSPSVPTTQPTASLPPVVKPSQIKVEPAESAADAGQLVATGGGNVPMNPLPATIHHGVATTTPPPGKVAISASPKVALPTPIKIGNHTLNLNLTVDQKEKVLGYLSKMTPEQQQQQISLFLKLQRQQQLQAQVNAQVKAQQALQQKQSQGPALTPTSSKLPVTVQQLEGKPATATKPAEHVQLTTPVATATTSSAVGMQVTYAAIPKSQLIHQQLSKDQGNALKPDTKSPFRSRRDTYRRLLRYHVFQSKLPDQELMKKDHEMFKNVSAGLIQKKQRMFDKFRLLILKESMRERKTAEIVMIQRMMNEDLKETLKLEKEQVKTNPDSFEPMPIKYLQKQESIKSEDMSTDEQNASESLAMSKVIKCEQMDHSDIETVEIKKEPTSRPCTPKVKLVIRNDGQHFTSSLADDGSSVSNDSIHQDDSVHLDTMETDLQNYKNSESNSDDISSRLYGASHLLNIKQELMNEECESMESDHWSDSNKPFKTYLDTDPSSNSPVSNSDIDVGMYGNSSLSPAENASQNEFEVHASDGGSGQGDGTCRNNVSSFEMSESVHHLGYHSSEKEPVCRDSFSENNLFHSHNFSHESDGLEREPFKSSFLSDLKAPFSLGSDLFKQTFEAGHSSKHGGRSVDSCDIGSAVSGLEGFHPTDPMSQYEPISSPEADHDESFSSLISHKVDSAYSIGMGDQKDPSHHSGDMPFNMPAFSSSHLEEKLRENMDDDEATTVYGDDSDRESDSQQELLKAQMESAINSIVSLNQDSSHHSPFSLDQSNKFFSHHSFLANPETESDSDTPGPSSPAQPDSPDNDTMDVSMDDDLDAAVNSILM